MSRLIILAALILFGCSTLNFGLNNRLALAYASTDAYVTQTTSLLQRGRITKGQAQQASENAKKAKAALDYASGLSTVCPSTPCTTQDQLAIAEGILLQLERDLKEKEKIP